MAIATGYTTSPLLDDLLAHGHEYTFDQVIYLTRRVLGEDNVSELPDSPLHRRVHIRPDLSLAFPAADVAGVARTGKDGADFLITTTFLGYYGASSPLPTHYTESLMDEAAADSSVSRDFIDILHQRLYLLFWECWKKYRLFIRLAMEKNPQDRERLFCLIGLGERELRESQPDSWSLVRFAGLLTQFPRSASGLQTLLRDALGVAKLSIEQCVARMVTIPVDQQMIFGSGMRLGISTILGCEVPDRMGKFRLHIGPLSIREFDSFLPGTPRYKKLVRLVRLYITDPLEFDLQVTLAANEATPMVLGDPNGQLLGWNSFNFAGDTWGEVSAIFSVEPSVAYSAETAESDIYGAPERTVATTLVEFYQQELASLRELALRYAEEHPELASMISAHRVDPGMERLFEGTAFLNALLRMKLTDDYPEIIYQLTESFQPWHIRPIPATTIVAFAPKPELVQPVLIPAGAEVDSIPVQGTSCRFRTCFDVTVHPVTLLNTSFSQPSGKAPCISLQCELNGIGLSGWKTNSLRLFLGDDYPAASDLYLLLTRYLNRIVITAPDCEVAIEIPAECLKPVGFGTHEALLASESGSLPGHLILQEFFLFRDKFLFIDLFGMDACRALGGGSRFEIQFELTANPLFVPQVNDKSFVLSAAPVINLFPHKALPISFNADLQQHAIRPEGDNPAHYRIFSVDHIQGLVKKGSSKFAYTAQNTLHKHTPDRHHCTITQNKSQLNDGFDTFITVPAHKNNPQNSRKKLDIGLTCTNGILPEQLNIGDVCTITKTIPESVEPGNIKTVTSTIFQDTGKNRQWRLLAGFSLNSVSLTGIENFRAILRLFVLPNCRDRAVLEANNRRIDGIVGIDSQPTDWLVNARMLRGYVVRMKVCDDHYAGPGDLYLFGSVLERFLGGYVTGNSFIRLVVEVPGKGNVYDWPARMGDRCVV